MGALVFLLIIALVGYVIFLQVMARRQIDVDVSLGKIGVQEVIDGVFGSFIWTRCQGPGHVNLRPKLRAKPPTISIDVEPGAAGGATVQIWMSAWKSRYGIVAHAQLVWRKKRQLALRLQAGNPAVLRSGGNVVAPSRPSTPAPPGQAPPRPAARPAGAGPSPTPRRPTSGPARSSAPPRASQPEPTPEQRLMFRLLRESPVTIVVSSPGDLRQLVGTVGNAVGSLTPASATHFVLGPPKSTMWTHALALPRGDSMLVASLVSSGAPDMDSVRSRIERPLRQAIESNSGGAVRIYLGGQSTDDVESIVRTGRVVAPAELLG